MQPACDFATNQISGLRAHLRAHSGENSSKCYLCDYKISVAGDLKKHLITHSVEKTKKCNVCDCAIYQAKNWEDT